MNVLSDDQPRSVGQLLNVAITQAATHGVQLVVTRHVTGEPPVHILDAFNEALGALVANLMHAKVTSARLTVDAGPETLYITLVDEGVGRQSGSEWGPSTQARVFDRLKPVGTSARVLTAPDRGTTWQLEWCAW